ncbi:hypothetical protein TEA_025099 [Camellia sinensis var. sinensis]|uniref:Uncharacterized protein n=1 Tax=Camellia sinensis var. sinensis TaxID=542762 RepID=A0A4S4E319_CAMSN|nr:hypothetical protein TEA_025099 [Camellia sinensis var. sinensis]
MAHNEDLPQSAIDGQTPEGGARREGLPSIPPMANLEPQRQNPRRDTRGRRRINSPRHSRSRSPDRQRRRIDPQVLEDRVKEQDELIRKMAVDMEALKRQMKGKGEATGEGRKSKTPHCRSEDRGKHSTLSQAESRSLRTVFYRLLHEIQVALMSITSKMSNQSQGEDSADTMAKAMKASDDLYNIRDSYFPSNPDDKISRLQSDSDLALKLLDSIPSGERRKDEHLLETPWFCSVPVLTAVDPLPESLAGWPLSCMADHFLRAASGSEQWGFLEDVLSHVHVPASHSSPLD